MAGEQDLRGRVEGAILDALERVGPEALDRGAVLRPFDGQGASLRTLYRWAAEFINSGRAGQALVRRVEAAAAARAARTPDPGAEVARDVGALLPKTVTPDMMIGGGPIAIMDQLREAIGTARQVMGHARTPEGAVRNAKLLLSASTTLRQCLDTAVRVQQALTECSKVEEFHEAILDALRQEAPETAERVLVRLRQLNEKWEGA